jgi:hypothetical protein
MIFVCNEVETGNCSERYNGAVVPAIGEYLQRMKYGRKVARGTFDEENRFTILCSGCSHWPMQSLSDRRSQRRVVIFPIVGDGPSDYPHLSFLR